MIQAKTPTFQLTIAGLLIALGTVIPIFSPIKIMLEPASFTLASHVAIFIAMFISPGMAAAVSVGTTLGFFIGGFPVVIVLRAASHIVFATSGAFYLQKKKEQKSSFAARRGFSFFVALAHALCELTVVSIFYFDGGMGTAYYQKGFLTSVLLLVGLGTVVHSMVDFEIAYAVVAALRKSGAMLANRRPR